MIIADNVCNVNLVSIFISNFSHVFFSYFTRIHVKMESWKATVDKRARKGRNDSNPVPMLKTMIVFKFIPTSKT